jgi:hypothetical protein
MPPAVAVTVDVGLKHGSGGGLGGGGDGGGTGGGIDGTGGDGGGGDGGGPGGGCGGGGLGDGGAGGGLGGGSGGGGEGEGGAGGGGEGGGGCDGGWAVQIHVIDEPSAPHVSQRVCPLYHWTYRHCRCCAGGIAALSTEHRPTESDEAD